MSLPDDTARDLRTAGRKAREWTTRRDELILAAHTAGGGVREIARTVGLSHPAVSRILRRDTNVVKQNI